LRYEDGHWWITNIAPDKRIWAQFSEGNTYLKRWPVRTGDVVLTPNAAIHISGSSTGYNLKVRTPEGQTRSYHIDLESKAPRLDPASRSFFSERCSVDGDVSPSFPARLKKWLGRNRNADSEHLIARIQGVISCPHKLGLPGGVDEIGRIYRKYGRLYLAPSGATASNSMLMQRQGEKPRSFTQIAWSVDNSQLGQLREIIVGRTTYAVAVDPDNNALKLKPIGNLHLLSSLPVELTNKRIVRTLRDRLALPLEGRAWPTLWQRHNVTLIVMFVLISGTLIVPYWLQRTETIQTSRITLAWASSVILAASLAALVCALLLFELGWQVSTRAQFAAAWVTLLTASFALILAPIGIRTVVFWLAMISLIALGAMTLGELAGLEEDTGNFQYINKHLRSIAIVGFFTTVTLLVPNAWWKRMAAEFVDPNATTKKLLAAAIALFALFVLFWVLFGNERGVADIQPVELSKFFAVVVLVIMIIRFEMTQQYSDHTRYAALQILWLGGGVATYAIMFTFAPYWHSDFSPMLILIAILVTLVAVCWTWLRVQGVISTRYFSSHSQIVFGNFFPPMKRKKVEAFLAGLYPTVSLVLACSFILVCLFGATALTLRAEQIGKQEPYLLSTIDQRILVWHAPERYTQDIGYQVARSRNVLAGKECASPHRPWPISTMSRCTHLTDRSAQALAVPAVQNDFILAFFVHQNGRGGMMLLLVLQIVVLGLSVDAAFAVYRWHPGNAPDMLARQALAFATVGSSVLLAFHWLISWGNAFGFLPVMGQPMTWMSAANSHLLSMALPCLCITLITMRVADQH
ncbi:MAG: FtsW/RodA/SpoVE family cell cycle protein, partial [Gammaproteobacteria bacterium]|nr:FtsW/RodA/SpoVE family cell cycle protein [Gammaproteobacteria bacterium]